MDSEQVGLERKEAKWVGCATFACSQGATHWEAGWRALTQLQRRSISVTAMAQPSRGPPVVWGEGLKSLANPMSAGGGGGGGGGGRRREGGGEERRYTIRVIVMLAPRVGW